MRELILNMKTETLNHLFLLIVDHFMNDCGEDFQSCSRQFQAFQVSTSSNATEACGEDILSSLQQILQLQHQEEEDCCQQLRETENIFQDQATTTLIVRTSNTDSDTQPLR